MEESRYIGVDPGQSGGVSVLDISGEIVDVVAFKKMTLHDIAEWFREWRNDRTWAVIESVHSMPKQGVASSFKFGHSFGFLEGCLVALQIPYDKVTPAKWQGNMGCRTKGDKNVSKSAAQRRWPDHRMTHAIADSLLIAEYGRRHSI